MKISLLLFLLLPSVLYSQYLEQRDINIFVKNGQEIGLYIMNGLESNNNDDWRNYFELIHVQSSDIYGSVESFNNYFQTFMNCEIPNDLENLFREKGWITNGHRKYWTIMNGFMLISLKRNMEMSMEKDGTSNLFPMERYFLVKDILGTFNVTDLDIIEEIIKSLT